MTAPGAPNRSALVVAHPGHELMVYGWMETARPLYCCLTDGSGGGASSRMDSTTRLLASVGARQGPVYGRFPDKQVYRHLLEGQVEIYARLVDELADAWIENGVDTVAGDAVEGFNPSHDLCRFLIDAAVERVRGLTGRTLRNYDFVLDSAPDACPEPLRREAIWLQLDPSAVARKIAAALAYEELRGEVEAALARFGPSAYAGECLRPSTTAWLARFEVEPPQYERSGEIRVGEGRYQDVLRYREHILPARAAIELRAGVGTSP